MQLDAVGLLHDLLSMNRVEFHALRDLPDKKITADIVFAKCSANSSSFTFDNIPVENALNWDVIMNGTFKPEVPTVTYNFYVRSQGPICRMCVNGTHHGNGGRTHKHELREESDQRLNLPTVFARPEYVELTPREVWCKLLAEAKIVHTGIFIDPQ